MSKIKYIDWNPSASSLALIEKAEEICQDLVIGQGYDLTLRQLYYQFVSRDLIPNTMQSYKRLGSIISDARMAGLLDWSYIVDRTRSLYGISHQQDVESAINDTADRYRINRWEGQPTHVEVWVEKDALSGVVGRAASAWDVDYFPCKGNVSSSELHDAGRYRLKTKAMLGQHVVILHLGDHDPNGMDMTRDITDRLSLFMGSYAENLEVRRIALNMDQIEQYNPPPNPVKFTDSRAASYVEQYGTDSWELDALAPAVLDELIQSEIRGLVDMDLYEARRQQEQDERDAMQTIARRWDEVTEWIEETS